MEEGLIQIFNQTYQTWTLEADNSVRQLLEEGKTRAEIAKELGVTKGAVSGRIHRLGIQLPRHHPSAIKASEAKKRKSQFTKRDRTQRVGNRGPGRSTKVAKQPLIMQQIEEIKIEKPTSIVEFNDLRDGMCRYPLWDFQEKPTGFYCGSPISAPEGRIAKSFCMYHHALCFVAPRISDQGKRRSI